MSHLALKPQDSSSKPKDTSPPATAWTPGTAEKNYGARRKCQRCQRKPRYRRMCRECSYLVGPCCERVRYADDEVLCVSCATDRETPNNEAVTQAAGDNAHGDGHGIEKSDAQRGDEEEWEIIAARTGPQT